jgi:hypothetical protein
LQQAAAPAAQAPDFEGQVKEGLAKIHESVVKVLPEIKDMPLQFNNNKDVVFDYKYSFSNQEKEQVAEVLKDYGQFFDSRYTTKDGGYDGQKLAQDVLLLQNFEKIMQATVTEAIMKERLDFINKSANYSNGREVVPSKTDAVKEQERKQAQSWFSS